MAGRKAQIRWKFPVNKDLTLSQIEVGLLKLSRLDNWLSRHNEVIHKLFIHKRKDFFMKNYLVNMLRYVLRRSTMGQDFSIRV